MLTELVNPMDGDNCYGVVIPSLIEPPERVTRRARYAETCTPTKMAKMRPKLAEVTFKMGKMSFKIAKMRPKMAKIRFKMVKTRPKMAKMRLQMAKDKPPEHVHTAIGDETHRRNLTTCC